MDVASAGTATLAVEALMAEDVRLELARLAELLGAANEAYHTQDAPIMSDADYDALKRRNAAIEARFPELKRPDSPTDHVGAAPAEAFGKVVHRIPMLSLANEFAAEGIHDFDARVRCTRVPYYPRKPVIGAADAAALSAADETLYAGEPAARGNG